MDKVARRAIGVLHQAKEALGTKGTGPVIDNLDLSPIPVLATNQAVNRMDALRTPSLSNLDA